MKRGFLIACVLILLFVLYVLKILEMHILVQEQIMRR